MKERTEIDQQNLHFTYMELVSCRVYDDAKLLLNNLVVKELGREYGDKCHFDEETDEWICDEVKYKNSVNPKVVKLAVCDAMKSFLNSRELISEEGTIAYEKSKVRDTTIIPFKRMDNDVKKVRDWVQRWQKEPAPIIKEEKAARLRPKQGVDKYIEPMFLHLKELRNIDEQTIKAPWDYLCGMTDEIPKVRIKWTGGLFNLNVLIERFLIKNTYFDAPKGATSFICSLMVDENGNEIKPSSLKTTKNREFGRNAKRADEVWQSMRLTGLL